MRVKREKGVTLIELIMGIVIVGTLVGISSVYIKQVMNLWNFLNFRNESSAQASTTLIRMAREIRQIADNTAVSAADSSSLEFTAIDLDNDGNNDVIRFYRDAANNELRRVFNNNNSGNGDILAGNISTLSFAYYGSNNAALSPLPLSSGNRSKIKRISARLTVQSGTQSKTLKTQIWPRNL